MMPPAHCGGSHAANDYGFIPWAGLFTTDIDSNEAAQIRSLVINGKATTSIHAFESGTNRFYYFDHNAGDYPPEVVESNFVEANAWFQSRQIPIGTYTVPHFYEIGTNEFTHLKNDWNITTISTMMQPGLPSSGADWMNAGPFRKYENGLVDGVDGNRNVYYADYIPDYPDFFNCLTEIRDVTGYEWLGNGRTDVTIATADGTEWLKRALDSMAVADLFSHEYTFIDSMSETNWRSILAGITQNIAGYHPIFASRDYACAYARAVHDSDITAATYASGALSVTLGAVDTVNHNTIDMPTKFYVFTESGGQIVQQMADVPAFSGSTPVNYILPGALEHITITPGSASVATGSTRQFSAAGYDASGNPHRRAAGDLVGGEQQQREDQSQRALHRGRCSGYLHGHGESRLRGGERDRRCNGGGGSAGPLHLRGDLLAADCRRTVRDYGPRPGCRQQYTHLL